jgi:hypothetical protein
MTRPAILDRLRGVQRAGKGWLAFCPAHPDQHKRSLSVGIGDDGRTLLNCHAQRCPAEQIVGAVGMTLADLAATTGHPAANGHVRRRQEVAAYDYTDARGEQLYQVVRSEPKDFRCRRPDGAGGWTWNLDGVRVVPYRLPELAEARRVWVVEGEKDADQLAALGLTATCNHGGAGKWRPEHTAALVAAAVPEVVVVPDNDAPGLAHAKAVAERCRAAGLRVKILVLPGLPPKGDVSDWLAAGHSVAELEALADTAPVVTTAELAEADAAPIVAAELKEHAPTQAAPYTFTPAMPPDHFVSAFVAYARECTDTAHEYFEAVGLLGLAVAMPNLRARLRQYPAGLTTGFYGILIGDSTRSRKTSTIGLGLDLLDEAVPDCLLAEQASPEAFVEQLAARSHNSSLWAVDEFGETLDKLHHSKYMAGLRGLMLTLYEGRNYSYKRTTKRTKKGEPIDDSLRVDSPNLAILGATTPSIFEIVTARDVSSGFMARFAVVMPTSRPPRRGLEEPTADLVSLRATLAGWLSRIYLWAKSRERHVCFVGDALRIIDHFAETIETSDALANDRARAMLQRLNAMTVKLSMLAAVGRPGAVDQDELTVTDADARAAVAVATRWGQYAIEFGSRVGETLFEQQITPARWMSCARRAAAAPAGSSPSTCTAPSGSWTRSRTPWPTAG